ncbi:MAG: hypothetical protein V5A28_08515 [Haloarculaceae archaeon]
MVQTLDGDDRYDSSDLWLTRVVDHVQRAGPVSPAAASLLVFGLVPSAVLVWMVITRWGRLSPGFLAGVLGVGIWLTIAPYLVWRYDSVTFPTFVELIADIVADEAAVLDLTADYERLFTRRWFVPAIPTTVLGIPMMVLGRPFLRESASVTTADPLYWALVGVVLWLGVLIGIGVAGVATSVLVVRAFTDHEFDIAPLHPDGKGGLSAVGALAVRTTVLLSLGSFLLPIQFHYVAVAGSDLLRSLVYLLVAGYTAIIFLSFVYPVVTTNRYAERLRARNLENLRAEYYEVKAESDRLAGGGEADGDLVAVELRAQRLRDEYRRYETVTLYPTDVTVLSRFAGSILLPLFFTVLDAFLGWGLLARLMKSLV